MTAISASALSSPLPQQDQRLRQQAEELEGVFLNTLVSQMFAGLDSKNGFGGGFAEDTWRSIQSEQLANQIAQSGGIGLADQILASLLDVQEANQNLESFTVARKR